MTTRAGVEPANSSFRDWRPKPTRYFPVKQTKRTDETGIAGYDPCSLSRDKRVLSQLSYIPKLTKYCVLFGLSLTPDNLYSLTETRDEVFTSICILLKPLLKLEFRSHAYEASVMAFILKGHSSVVGSNSMTTSTDEIALGYLLKNRFE